MKLSLNYSDAFSGHAEIGRQAWLRAKWEFPMRVRVSLAAPDYKFSHSGLVISTFAAPHTKSFFKNSFIFGSVTLTKANGKG